MSDSQQPQTPLARLEQLERQIASKVEEVVQGLRQEIGDGVRNAGEEIQRLLDAVRDEKEESAPEPAPAPAPSGPGFGDLVGAVARIDGQSGQADVIKTLLEESAPYASRAVFFLVRQQQIRAWSSRGFGSGSGRVEGLQATTDQAPWDSVPGDASSILDAEQTAAFAKTFGSSTAADAAWVPFILRGQLAGALYVDRLEGDDALDAAALQLLTHSAATSLETAVSNPNVSATLELRGKLPEVIAEEHTIAVDEDEASEMDRVAVPEVEDETDEPTEETTDEPTGETTEETTGEVEETDDTEDTEDTEEETEEPTDVSDDDSEGDEADVAEDAESGEAAEAVEAPAVELPKMKIPEVSAPDVSVPDVSVPEVAVPAVEVPEAAEAEEPVEIEEEFTEPPDFEMVEDTLPESEPELEVEPGTGDDLPAEALAAPPEVPDVELGEPEAPPEFEVAEAPEVPDLELGEPEPAPEFEAEAPKVPDVELAGEVDDDEIALETEDETPLDEDGDLWEADDDEATAPGEAEEDDGDASVVTQPAAPEPATPEPAAPESAAPEPVAPASFAGNETVRIDTTNLQQAAAPEPATPEPAAPQADAVQYPSSFAEPPAPVQAPPPSFAEPEAPPEPEEPSSSQVTPPPDVADAQPSSQVTPPADATPTSEVAPPEPPGSSTEVKPPTDLEGPGLAFAAPTPAQAEREMDDAEEALHEEARRLARLLVSEIKLYNEEIIEEGRRTGNIYDRLKDDINRSRQMYEERIDPRLADQEDYFHQELVQRLAGGGDESLLGV